MSFRRVLSLLTILGLSAPCAIAAGKREITSADEVRSIVPEMMSDAESRSSLMESGGKVSAGPGGFVISSDDDAFRLRISGYT